MFPDALEFRFPKGLPFWKKLKLKKLCRNTDLNVSGYSDYIALSAKVKEKYKLQVSTIFCGNTITFYFEKLKVKSKSV